MAVRYSLLTYMYTLFYHAHTNGETVMRALAWEFPDDASLRGTFSQFMLGPSILVTPVLQPNVDYVNGVFPGIGQSERWYDWYSLQAAVSLRFNNRSSQLERRVAPLIVCWSLSVQMDRPLVVFTSMMARAWFRTQRAWSRYITNY
jgi:hypothetical protein